VKISAATGVRQGILGGVYAENDIKREFFSPLRGK
jgi:hypothetical protein